MTNRTTTNELNREYEPGSTMYELGFRTEKEYIEAQRYGATRGLHEGRLAEQGDTIFLTRRDGTPYVRVTPTQFQSMDPDFINETVQSGQFMVSAKNWEGKEVRLTSSQAKQLQESSGQSQFNTAKKLGLVPMDSKYVAGEGKNWGYIADFQKGISERKETRKEIKSASDASKAVEKYKVEGGYNLDQAVADKVPSSTLLKAGFTQKQINESKKNIKITTPAAEKQVEAPTTDRLKTITVLGKKLPVPNKPLSPLDKATREGLTPWDESKGETLGTYLKEYVNDVVLQNKVRTQEELKTIYEADKSQPMWVQVLFGDSHVMYNSKTGKYYEVLYGVAPAVGPTGQVTKAAQVVKAATKGKTAIMGAKEARMSATEYAQFIAARAKNPNLSPEVFKATQAVKQGATPPAVNWTKATQETKKVLSKETWRDINRLADQIKKAKTQAQVTNAWKDKKYLLAEIEKARERAGFRIADASNIKLPTKSETSSIVKLLSTRTPSQFVAGFASNPVGMTGILTQLSPKEAQLVITAADHAFQNAPKAQQKAWQQLQVELQLQVLEQTATETAQQLQLQEQTQTQIQEAVQTAVEQQVQTITNTEVKNQVKPQTKPITDRATKTVTPTPMPTPSKPSPTPPPRTPDKPPPTKVPPKIKIKRPHPEMPESKQRKVIKEKRGSITWRQGKLHGKDVWHVIVHPYQKEDYYMILGRKPVGARMVSGPGSAYATAEVIHGVTIPEPIHIDMGITDIKLSPSGKKDLKISFEADPKLQTRGDITLGNNRGKFPLPRKSE